MFNETQFRCAVQKSLLTICEDTDVYLHVSQKVRRARREEESFVASCTTMQKVSLEIISLLLLVTNICFWMGGAYFLESQTDIQCFSKFVPCKDGHKDVVKQLQEYSDPNVCLLIWTQIRSHTIRLHMVSTIHYP